MMAVRLACGHTCKSSYGQQRITRRDVAKRRTPIPEDGSRLWLVVKNAHRALQIWNHCPQKG